MAEVLLQFDPPLKDGSGVTYVARVCGREGEDSLWDGWIEFDPEDGGEVLRTPRETQQPNRTDLEYWATGLTVSYLEGALERARDPRTPDLRPRTVDARPSYAGPAAAGGSAPRRPAGPISTHAVLDPFQVYAQGEELLREQLGALDEGHLRQIVRAYELVPESEVDLLALGETALAELVVAAVRKRAG